MKNGKWTENRRKEMRNEQEWDNIELEQKWKIFFRSFVKTIFERKSVTR